MAKLFIAQDSLPFTISQSVVLEYGILSCSFLLTDTFLYLSIYQSIYLSIYLSVYASIYLSISQSIYLYKYIYIYINFHTNAKHCVSVYIIN